MSPSRARPSRSKVAVAAMAERAVTVSYAANTTRNTLRDAAGNAVASLFGAQATHDPPVDPLSGPPRPPRASPLSIGARPVARSPLRKGTAPAGAPRRVEPRVRGALRPVRRPAARGWERRRDLNPRLPARTLSCHADFRRKRGLYPVELRRCYSQSSSSEPPTTVRRGRPLRPDRALSSCSRRRRSASFSSAKGLASAIRPSK